MGTMPLSLLGVSSDELWLDAVPPEGLDLPLQMCLPHLEFALEKNGGEMTEEGLVKRLATGKAVLLIECLGVVAQGCAVVQFIDFDRFRAAHFLALAALPGKRHPYPNEQSFALLAKWCKAQGASVMQGCTNPATSRLWGKIKFEEVYRTMRIKL